MSVDYHISLHHIYLLVTSSMCADGKESGFLIDGTGSVAGLVRCEVRTCAQSGVGVTNGALATLERVLVEGSRGGDGVRVAGEGAQMQAKECRILRCQMHGVLACEGATAELTQCETKQNKAGGFSCEGKGSMLSLAACASDFDAQVRGAFPLCMIWIHCACCYGRDAVGRSS